MAINETKNYIEIGTEYDKVNPNNDLVNSFKLPAPIELPFNSKFIGEVNNNANGSLIVQQIARSQYHTSLKWYKLHNKWWWTLNRWFDENGVVFYVRFFNHITGKIQISKFYRESIEAGTPSTSTEDILLEMELEKPKIVTVPLFYYNCGINLVDVGDEVIETDIISVEKESQKESL